MRQLLAIVLLTGLVPAQDQVHYPPKPGPREFVLDEAHLLSPEATADIRKLCEEVLTKKQAPIVVVTIPSLAQYGASGWPIERYAMNLMAEWGVGWPEWNYGMLLLVSPGDRKARIELGGSWARRKDDAAQQVMNDDIIPLFKQGKMADGIVAGVRGLHAIAMELTPPRPATRAAPPPANNEPPDSAPAFGHKLPGGACGILPLAVIGILVLVFVGRLFRRGGSTSWGNGGPGMFGGGYGGGGGFGSGLGGGILGGALGSMIGNAISNRSRGSSSSGGSFGGGGFGGGSGGGSFGGGSFGGGFSGGGGATGSW